MDPTKIAIAHVAGEIILIGGVSFYFSKKLSALQTENEDLKKRIEALEKGESGGGFGEEQLEELNNFKKQTTGHINNLYAVLKQIAENQTPHQHINPQVQPSTTSFVPKKKKEKQVAAEVTNSRVVRTPAGVLFASVTETMSSTPIKSKKASKATIEEIPVDEPEEEEEVNEEDLDRELEEELEELKKPVVDQEEPEEDVEEPEQKTKIEFLESKKKKVVKKKVPKA